MSNQRPSDEGRASALAISGWPLSRKVALALAIPLLLAATLGGLRVQSDLEESSNASSSAQQVTILRPAVDYLTSAERAMVAAQSSTGASKTELDDAVEDIKAAAAELTDTVETADLSYEQRLQVASLLDLSLSIRDENTGSLSPDTWIAQLRQLQSGVTKLITTITSAQDTPEPRLELLAQTLGGRFSLAMQQALGSDVDRSRSVSQALFSELGAESAAIDRLAGAIDDAEAAVRTLRTNNGARTRSVRTGTSTVLGGSDAYDEYDKLAESLLLQVDQGLAATATNARERALFDAAITLFALLAAIALALVISRSLLGPIRRVREGALQVANEDLPDAVARIRSGKEPAEFVPIDVDTHEEIGQLARAVDDLHRQAVTLASGEAQLRTQVGEMFVTLSRRNTTLINQQLNLIEALEKDEEDPKRLESLFRLDHLASRMRRTADSLLILADAPTRSAGWESLTVTEATQAATAGVQDYQRVRISSTLDSRIEEAAAGDLIHLLTELVDNALSYSSPSTHVTLSTAPAPGGLTIDVSDSGLGIPEESLRQINETLESGADVTPDTARRMGLFVVSRLAQRHGIQVALATNPASGITATVFVPATVLPDGAPAMPQAPAEVEPVLEEAVEPEQAPFVPEIVSDETIEQDDTTEDAAEPAASATVIGLPTRQPGSSMGDREAVTGLPSGDASTGLPSRQPGSTLAQRGLATGADVPSDTPSARNTAAPRPERGAMPLRSRRTALTDGPSAGEAPAAQAPAVPAAGSAFSDVTADDAPDTADELASVTALREEPSTDEVVNDAAEAEAPADVTVEDAAGDTAEDPAADESYDDAPVAVSDEPETVEADVVDEAAAEAPELPASVTTAPVSTHTVDPLSDPLTDPLPEEPTDEAPQAPTAPDAPAARSGLGGPGGLGGLPTRRRGGTLSDQEAATSPFRDAAPAAHEAPEAPAAPVTPAAPAALAGGLAGGPAGGLPTRQRGGTLSDQEAATKPFRDSVAEPAASEPTAPVEVPVAEVPAAEVPAVEAPVAPAPEAPAPEVDEVEAPAAEVPETREPETPAALVDGEGGGLGSGPGGGPGGGLTGLPTRRRGGTLSDQQAATSPFRESTIEAPAAPTAPALAGVSGGLAPQGGGLDTLPSRQRGGTLSDQDDANRPFRDGGLGTRPAEVTSLAQRRELASTPAPAEAPVARTAPEPARPQVGRASSLTRFRPASATRRASYEASGGGPQEPLRTERVVPAAASNGSRTALDGDVKVEHDAEDNGSIFGSLRSSWLTSEGGSGWQSTEVEAGWQRAEDVAESAKDAPAAGGGLPIRRPGTLLVPGGITKPTTIAPRDPEAIRNRYAAYAAGVSRGRKTSTSSTDDRTH